MLEHLVALVAVAHLVIQGLRDAGYCQMKWLPRGHLKLLGLLAIAVLVGGEVSREVGPLRGSLLRAPTTEAQLVNATCTMAESRLAPR